MANDQGDRLYGPAQDSQFGSSVAYLETSAGQAGYLVVGAPGARRAYRYVNDLVDGKPAGLTFTQDAEYMSIVSKAGDRFGTSVAASTCPVGAWYLVAGPGDPKAQLDGGGFLYLDGEPNPTWMATPGLISEPPLRWGGMPPDWWKKWTPQIPKYLG